MKHRTRTNSQDESQQRQVKFRGSGSDQCILNVLESQKVSILGAVTYRVFSEGSTKSFTGCLNALWDAILRSVNDNFKVGHTKLSSFSNSQQHQLENS